jgi:hypothetical protein
MKFSKSVLTIAALFAVTTFSTVKPSSYLARAKQAAADAAAKAKEAYNKAQKALADLGGVEGVKGMATQAQGYYNTGKGYLGTAQGYYNKYLGKNNDVSAADQAKEEAMMEEMNAYAREQGLGTN